MKHLFYLLLTLISCSSKAEDKKEEDSYLWLEEIQSESSLSWVKTQNEISTQTLEKDLSFEPLKKRFLSILNSNEKIAYVQKEGKYFYNFWRDDQHARGLLRRTSLEEYVKENPSWETVLDLDALATAENENWNWSGDLVLYPTYDHTLIFLSRGGGDATVVREFDLEKKQFVADGFCLPEAKGFVFWKDKDTLYVGTDFGPGSLTSSGYPRTVKEWTRGTPLTQAKLIFEANETDMLVQATVNHDHGHTYEWITQALTFFTYDQYLHKNDQWVKLEKPADVYAQTFREHLLFTLQSDWTVANTTYSAGTLLAVECEKYLQGDRSFHILFEPTERATISNITSTKDFLILGILENIQNKIRLCKWENGKWQQNTFDAPAFGSTSLTGLDRDESNAYFMTHSDYLTPTTLWLGDLDSTSRKKIKSLPSYFSAENLEIKQFEALSKDGTRVPYFQVSQKQMPLDTQRPTLLFGYGGFRISLQPSYKAIRGAGWLEQGGVYVEANIRGGGEFGPKWHNAARKENRQLAYDDFIAVAEDLVARKVTSPNQLAIEGGSNGGLLMGVMLTQRPDLFKAVICQVPLLDMKRYHKLLAGASWMDEYGDPDKEADWSYLQKYSPYQNIQPAKSYPEVLMTTSTKDDRVHPGHARKMTAKMQDLGYKVLYYENQEGGHSGAVNNEQIAYKSALEYMFLKQKLNLD